MAKKTAQATPNHLLRRARLERGWTQKMVAERIGAPNDVLVTRWERGTAFPSAYYVERLCQLFAQRASELGLLKESHTPVMPHRSRSRSDSADEHMTLFIQQNAPLLFALPLVGREADIDTLKTLYQHVQQGRMQVALIQGEAGIGKTRLASAFLDWAVAQGAVLLQGRAFEMGGRLPYQPLVHALSRRLEEEQAPETLLSATWLSELSRILPDLRERYPFLPEAPGDEMTARIRLFEAVTRLGQAFCARAPVVLSIDDIHWADAASLDVLHYAGQRWYESGTPLLLLLSARSEALTPTGSLSKWISSLRHDLPVTDLTPGPFTLEATLHLLEAIVQQQASNTSQSGSFIDIGQWLFRETHGQPFYLVETLKDLAERQILTIRSTPQGEELELDLEALSAMQHQSVLPPGVRRLILSQLERLTTMGRSLLTGSAILGQGASFDLLCRVAEVDERDALAALEEVMRQRLLHEFNAENARGPHYILGHDKIREVITTEMGEAKRRLLHRHVLAVLETEARPAAELAHHALAAGLIEQAIHFSLTAGDEAVRLFANTEAQLYYTQALEALSQIPETTVTLSARVETLLKLVEVSWMAVDVALTLERLAEAEKLAHALDDQRQLASTHYWIAVVYGTRNAMRKARPYADRALTEARELGDEELVALASIQLSRVLILQGQFSSIEELLTPIIPVLEREANWLHWTYARGYLGTAYAARGHCAAGVAQGQYAVERAQRAGEINRYHGIMARHFLSTIYFYANDFSQMLSENDQVVQEAQQIGDWLLLYWAYSFRSRAQGLLGKYEEAMQSLACARAAGSRLGEHIMGQDLLEAVTAELLLATDHIEEALAQAEATIELAREEAGDLQGEGIAERVWGQALARLSRWEEAQKHLAASVKILLSGESLLEAARTQVVWGLLCHDHGDRSAAQAHFEQALAQYAASRLTDEYETVQKYLAQIDPR